MCNNIHKQFKVYILKHTHMWECTQVILFSISFQLSGLSTLFFDIGIMLRAQSWLWLYWCHGPSLGRNRRLDESGAGVERGRASLNRRSAAGLGQWQGPKWGIRILIRAASILKKTEMMCCLLFTSKHVC